jgi:hypothetical protein
MSRGLALELGAVENSSSSRSSVGQSIGFLILAATHTSDHVDNPVITGENHTDSTAADPFGEQTKSDNFAGKSESRDDVNLAPNLALPKQLRRFGSALVTQQVRRERHGVYFLCLKGKVVYVGKSRNVVVRIHAHLDDRRKRFDSAYYILLPSCQTDEAERTFISHFKPVLNGKGTGVPRCERPWVAKNTAIHVRRAISFASKLSPSPSTAGAK